MFAVIETGGKQYKVQVGTIVDVEKLDVAPSESVVFDRVLLVSDGTELKLGTPVVEGAKVTAKVLNQVKADKIIVFKFKRKTGYKRTQGHRQKMTTIKVESIAK